MAIKIKSTEQYVCHDVSGGSNFWLRGFNTINDVTIHLKPLQHYFYIVLINLLQDTYKPNPWYFPHNFDIAAKGKVQQLTMRIEKKEI